jgi:hypothetical protein
MNPQFSFLRMRYQFQAKEPLRFPPGMAANTIRGALGWALHGTGDDVYRAIFEPKQEAGKGPSGLGDLPRPFVLRAAHLNGRLLREGEPFSVDVNVFSAVAAPPGLLENAFEKVAERGFGNAGASGRATFLGAQSLDLEGEPNPGLTENTVDLSAGDNFLSALTVRFVTPTELKADGGLARTPEFPILFARARDRLRSLSEIYGTPLKMDFDGLTIRAAAITLRPTELRWEKAERTSRKTGQTHPLGGFLGRVRYEGELGEYLPLLQAACWTGVGRQTVWGKGELEVRTS